MTCCIWLAAVWGPRYWITNYLRIQKPPIKSWNILVLKETGRSKIWGPLKHFQRAPIKGLLSDDAYVLTFIQVKFGTLTLISSPVCLKNELEASCRKWLERRLVSSHDSINSPFYSAHLRWANAARVPHGQERRKFNVKNHSNVGFQTEDASVMTPLPRFQIAVPTHIVFWTLKCFWAHDEW